MPNAHVDPDVVRLSADELAVYLDSSGAAPALEARLLARGVSRGAVSIVRELASHGAGGIRIDLSTMTVRVDA